MERGRSLEEQFAAGTITRPAKEKKSGVFTLAFLPFFVFVCPRICGVFGQIARSRLGTGTTVALRPDGSRAFRATCARAEETGRRGSPILTLSVFFLKLRDPWKTSPP